MSSRVRDLADRLFLRLQMLEDAVCDSDLRIPPRNHFEKLKGKLDGLHSIRVMARGEARAGALDNPSYR
jgi:proteic killer suppression protein